MNRTNLPAVIACCAVVLSGCKKPEPAAPPVTVTVTPAIQKDVLAKGQWVGLLDGYQNTDIQAQVTGYLLTQSYKEGSFVKKGDLLFTIDSRPFEAALAQAQANYARAVAQAQLQQVTLERQTQLYKTKVISQQEYDTSYQDTQAALASVASQQAQMQAAQVNLDYCTIKAPFDGIAGVAQAQIGDLVGPGGRTAILTQLSQVDPMKMNFSITEAQYLRGAELIADLQDGKIGNSENPQIELGLADGSVYPHKGKFDFVNRQVNTSTGTIQITALFPNPGNVLRPGLFGKVTSPLQMLHGAIVVPQAATVEMQGNYFVSVLQPDNTVKATRVKLGPTEGDQQVVIGDVKAGDQVVVGGIEKARPGTKVVAKPYQPPTPAAAQ